MKAKKPNVLPDGSIQLAPIYVAQFDKLSIEKKSLQDMFHAFMDIYQTMLRPIIEREKFIWKSIESAYGLDTTLASYKVTGDKLTKLNKKEEQ